LSLAIVNQSSPRLSHEARAMKILFWAMAAWAALSLAMFAAVMQTMI
jgi:hypothetical protein